MINKIDFKKELNSQQLAVVENIYGPQLVIAGAGSGKTRTIVYRIVSLIEKGESPNSILLLTFTRKAAFEMMRRASIILDDRCTKVSGGTFHSFAVMILKQYAIKLGYEPNFTILDTTDSEDLIGMIRDSLVNKKEKRFPYKNTIFEIISKSINTNRTIVDILKEYYPHFEEDACIIENIHKKYKETKKSRNSMDYDDLLINLRDLLKIDEIRIKLSNRYKFIMVDEYQDTNRLQAQISSLLASEHGNIMVVGDDAQSIYSFRGAIFKNIIDFPKIFSNAIISKLEQNYRSTQPILNFANAIIENAKEKYSKKLFSEIQSQQKPYLLYVKNNNEQAKFICKKIIDLMDIGISLNEIAVLFRSSYHSNELEVELNRCKIPYNKYGGIRFMESSHIKDILSYLRVIYNPKDDLAWYRILLLLERIGDKTAKKIIEDLINSKKGIHYLNEIDKNYKYSLEIDKLYKLLTSIEREEINISEKIKLITEYYMPFLKEKYDNYDKRIQDILILIDLSQKYKSIENFLTDMALEPPDQSQINVEQTDKEDEKLTLSTIHSAKGLEWHTVFIINLTDGDFPSKYSIDDNIEEERRLFYVAVTRAKTNLFLIVPYYNHYKVSNQQSYLIEENNCSEQSRFLKEMCNLDELIEKLNPSDYEIYEDNNSDLSYQNSKRCYYEDIKKFFD